MIERYTHFLNEFNYFFIILFTLVTLFSITVILAYIVLYLVKYYALLLPEPQQIEVILKVDYYISKLDEFLHSFKN